MFVLTNLSLQDDPYVFQQIDENGVVTYEGFCIDLLNEISNQLGFKYEIRVSPKNEYGNCNDEGVCNGMVKELVEKVISYCGVLYVLYGGFIKFSLNTIVRGFRCCVDPRIQILIEAYNMYM